jgi:L-aspartate oxidase
MTTPRTTSADVIVVGAGVAGLATALGLAGRRVHLICKGRLGATGASPLAQGGIAAAVGHDDSPALHAADTTGVAGGTADPEVVRLVTGEAPQVVERLVALGARLDRDASGALALGREAGHSRSRILHARDATGAEIVRAVTAAVRSAEHVVAFEERTAIDLAVSRGRVAGLWSADACGALTLHLAPAVVFATGGLGQIFARTSNPIEATGDGIAMAARAGVRLADLEFVQFHPTALDVGADPMPLVTEALRGAGAVILDDAGRRFLLEVDSRGELAPRDVVALALFRHLRAGRRAFLDAREVVGESFPERFPTVFEACRQHGLDPRRSPIPVAPAAHYHMGGIATDTDGRTSLEGLWACGEVACTGLHGANRLASNSLLEGIVLGGRIAADIGERSLSRTFTSCDAPQVAGDEEAHAVMRAAMRSMMWRHVGLERDEQGLLDAMDWLAAAARGLPAGYSAARNLLLVSQLVAKAALARRESRGSHFRADYPATEPAWTRRHVLETANPPSGGLAAAGGRR